MKRLIATLAVLLLTTASAVSLDLPGNANDRAFDEVMKSLDLERPDLEFHYKVGKNGGSTVGFHVAEPNRSKMGTFTPYGSSNNLEAEVVSYRLARFFEVSRNYNPVGYYNLGPQAAARFKAMLRSHSETDPIRAANYARTMSEFRSTPNALVGIYRDRPKRKKFDAASLCKAGKLDTSNPMATYIRANGPMPPDVMIALPGVLGQHTGDPDPTERQGEIARQLSTIMVIDMLVGQEDRCTGNLEAFGDSSGHLQLLSRDNGGATPWDAWGEFGVLQGLVTRFDHDLIDALEDLNAFLQGKTKYFAGFDNIDTWKTAVGYRRSESFRTFRRKLQLVVRRSQELERQYGPHAYFDTPGPSPETTVSAVGVDIREDEADTSKLATPHLTVVPIIEATPAIATPAKASEVAKVGGNRVQDQKPKRPRETPRVEDSNSGQR